MGHAPLLVSLLRESFDVGHFAANIIMKFLFDVEYPLVLVRDDLGVMYKFVFRL